MSSKLVARSKHSVETGEGKRNGRTRPTTAQPQVVRSTEVQTAISTPQNASTEALLQLQRSAGNQAVVQLLAQRKLQAKLTVGAADDPYEREADHIADQVTKAGPVQTAGVADDATLQRENEAGESVQRVSEARDLSGGFEAGHEVEQQLAKSHGGGSPLPGALRTELEPRFGADFGDVRVHTGAPADRLNRTLGAEAFTHRNDIYVSAGKYAPGTSAGKHLLAHELTHVVQQNGAGVHRSRSVQIHRSHAALVRGRRMPALQRKRTALTTKQILKSLNNIPFIREKLKTNIQKQKMETRLANTLRIYKQHFGKAEGDNDTRDAMMLSMALDGVARVIAEELGDVTIQSELAAKLFEAYKPEIDKQLGKQKWSLRKASARTPLLELTQALVGGNPVTQYMHREIRKEEAAASVIKMAANAKMKDPLTMYNLLEQRFQAQMAAYTRDQLHVGQDTDRFSTREAHGEYSQRYFNHLFGEDTTDKKGAQKWQDGGKGSAHRMAFTQDTETRLTELKNEVQHPSVKGNWVPRDKKLSEKQEQHLAEIESAEAKINMTDVKSQFVNLFKERYGLIDTEAATLYTEVDNLLKSAPFTITVQADKWFKDNKTPSPEFKPAAAAREQRKLSDVFKKKDLKGDVDFVKRWNDAGLKTEEQRGADYMRFRVWKDRLMTGNLGFKPEEMASFGALNINWDTSYGGDVVSKHGSNYYGDLHFKLNRNAVENRLIYTATDHGQPRRNPILALQDFTFGGRGLTWLKDTKKLDVLDNVVNAARTKKPIYGMPLVFEVQIFGGVNVKRDSDEVFLAPSVSKELKKAVTDFFQGTSVTVTTIGAVPQDAIAVQEADTQSVVTSLLAEGMLTKQQKTAVKQSAQNIPTGDGLISEMAVKGLMKGYTGGYRILQTLQHHGSTMTSSEFATLEKQLETIRREASLGKMMISGFIKDPEKAKALNKIQLKACEEAPTKLDTFLKDVEKAIKDEKVLRIH